MTAEELMGHVHNLAAAAEVVEAIDDPALQRRRGWDLGGWRYELVPWGVRFVRRDRHGGETELFVLAGSGADYIMAYLAKPVKPVDLQAAVRLAMLRFGHFQSLAKEAADLRQALEDRKLIERAKGSLMRRLRVDEEEAFRRLRQAASGKNLKLVEMSRQVIAAETVFSDFDR